MAHDDPVGHALFIEPFQVQFRHAPEVAFAHVDVSEVIAWRQEDRDFGGSPKPFQVTIRAVVHVAPQVPSQVQAFAIGHAGELIVVPEKEPSRPEVIGAGEKPRGVRAIDGSVDTDSPRLVRQAGRLPEGIHRECW